MLRYKIDDERLKKRIAEKNYRNLSHFIKEHDLNRATIYHYFKGQGPFSETYYDICDELGLDPLELLVPIFPKLEIPNIDHIAEIIKAILQKDPNISLGLFEKDISNLAQENPIWHLGISRGAQSLSTFDFLGIKGTVDTLAIKLAEKVHLINLDENNQEFFREITFDPIFLGGNQMSWGFFKGLLYGTQQVA